MKYSDYDPIDGGDVAADDLFLVVDVSDTSMAATGTNKALTAAGVALAASTHGPTPVLTPEMFGAIGDGTTDDAAALQDMFDAAGPGTAARFRLAAKTYRVASTIVVGQIIGSEVRGASIYDTKIKPDNGVTAFRFQTTDTHSVLWADFSVEWATNQASAAAWELSGTSGTTIYWQWFERVRVHRAGRGWACATGVGSQAWWASSWRDCQATWIGESAFKFAPSSAVGMPELHLDSVYIANTGGGPTPTGPAIKAVGVELSAANLGIEGWVDTAISVSGGGSFNVTNLHIESHTGSAAYSYWVDISDTPSSIEGASFSGSATSTDAVVLIRSNAGAMVSVSDLTHGVTITGSSYIREVLWCNNGTNRFHVLRNINKASGQINDPLTGSRSTENDGSMVLIGKLPSSTVAGISAPIVRVGNVAWSLPTASATYRGEIRFVAGGSGVADRLVVCRKDAANAYAWVDLF